MTPTTTILLVSSIWILLATLNYLVESNPSSLFVIKSNSGPGLNRLNVTITATDLSIESFSRAVKAVEQFNKTMQENKEKSS